MTAFTHQVWLIAIYAGIAGIFQAGLNLVFFDELLKTVPAEYSATFVSFAQSMEYMASIFAPMIGSYMADTIGLGVGLIISGSIRLLGFLLFFFGKRQVEILETS
jgi:cyanate permease